ncbi:hypothetical protein LAUMK136_04306 [Mycobacterium attenuatum]|uniref:Uncharacterized protein n=1 Tax=Mycobacterium attenuatum TaxID=2341086 RepID=A0A498QAU2_9MYCO|nr:hypothetical protein LAUMK136_04306 [Mycobacterium attenuatum]
MGRLGLRVRLRRARVRRHGRIGLGRAPTGQLVGEPISQTRNASAIKQLDDRDIDAQVALNLAAQLGSRE